MKFWRPGITGKLFVAIFATCIVLLITMHWAVRVSFERGFIDYIKHGNEQRLQGLSDALGNSIACTVTGVFCAITIVLYFKFCARWSTIMTTTVRGRACRRTAGAPSSG